MPNRHIDPRIVRGLVQAARGQLRVDVDYVSLSSEEQSGRNIVPHTLVYDGDPLVRTRLLREEGEYLDFVMSRFRGRTGSAGCLPTAGIKIWSGTPR